MVVPPLDEPVRLDRYLAGGAGLDLSRSFIQQIIDTGLVMVNGRAVSKSFRLKGGEAIVLTIPPVPISDLTPEEIPLEVVYEDDHLAVINKPAGMVVHPAPGNPQHTLVNALLFRFGRLATDADSLRPGIIHRLDKDTSGLLLVAKTDPVARALREQMAARLIIKTYRAVVCGHMPHPSGTIDLPIGRSMKDRKKMTVTHAHSREAVTKYAVLTRYRLVDLVEIGLVTGRTHQIRVHFSHLHHPVLGDPDYGGRLKWVKGVDPAIRLTAKKLLELMDRQALHAGSLRFIHPVTGKELTISSELPDDMRRLIIALDDEGR